MADRVDYRIIDAGGESEEEPFDDTSPVLVIFSIDPGITTGWSSLKVPINGLPVLGASRTLARCLWRHGQVGRSGAPAPSGGGAAYSASDSQHVSDLLVVARTVYEEWMEWTQDDETFVPWDSRFVFVMEGFDLRMMSMDANLLAPVRVASVFADRLAQAESDTPLFFQSPADAKRAVTDERLRRWGAYDPSSGAHARDADRHSLLFLRRFAAVAGLRAQIFDGDPFSQGWGEVEE